MPRDTLAGFFRDYIAAPAAARRPFVVHDNGFRARTWTYGEIAAASEAFAGHLRRAGLAAGDTLVIWSENRGEWIAALWGTRLASIVAVPVDFRASADQAHRIREIVSAKVMLVGAGVHPNAATGFAIWRMDDENLWNQTREPIEPTEPIEPIELAEIIFTSGATSDPKGVTLTDANLLANIHPIERELLHCGRYLRPLRPIRFLDLLPLSHMFGQSLATFVPPMLGGTVVFSADYSAPEIVRQIKSRRVTALVCVPKVLELLKEEVERRHAATRFRAHRLFGWKFWAIVVGGAPLAPELEQFWRGLGFLVIQGYGLTETAPIVTLNHPLKKGKAGTVGTPISGVGVRIADDGEILVRGGNVTEGYYGAAASAGGTADSPFDKDGWFHTGDIGEMDAEGRLTIKGRKKEMIVTAQGLNVFPDDVERAIDAQAGVRESAVVGVTQQGEERVHAVLVIEPGADTVAIVRGANAALEEHQRIRGVSVWPGNALPRTEGTRKLKRIEIQRWAQTGAAAKPASLPVRSVEEIVAAMVGRPVTADTRFDELGLGSLDRMQLLARVEDAFATAIDEAQFANAQTVSELSNLIEPVNRTNQTSEPTEPIEPIEPIEPRKVPPIPFPYWNQSLPIRALRRVSLPTWVLSITRPWMSLAVEGLENLEGLDHPVIFAPNHQSHMDTPAILQALPSKWRYRVSPAMAKEWFKAHFFPEQYPLGARVRNSAAYLGATIFYNAFPIPQYEGGTRQTVRYIGRLFDEKRSLLIFPEGKRTDYGEIAAFRPGVGLIASKLGVPVVPVRIEGLEKVLHLNWYWPKRGPVRVTFGKPMRLEGTDFRALASQVRDAVIALQPYEEPSPPRDAQA